MLLIRVVILIPACRGLLRARLVLVVGRRWLLAAWGHDLRAARAKCVVAVDWGLAARGLRTGLGGLEATEPCNMVVLLNLSAHLEIVHAIGFMNCEGSTYFWKTLVR
jgi:hypothetical protein